MANKLILGVGLLIIGALTFGDEAYEAIRGSNRPGSGKRGDRATRPKGDGGELDDSPEAARQDHGKGAARKGAAKAPDHADIASKRTPAKARAAGKSGNSSVAKKGPSNGKTQENDPETGDET